MSSAHRGKQVDGLQCRLCSSGIFQANLVPLLIAMPGQKGTTSKRVVELIDLYPTLAELCGLPKPERQSGESIARVVKDPSAQFDRPAYSYTVYGKSFGRSIETAKWHYVEWDEGGKLGNMLYALDDDPHELKNLSNDPKYAKVVEDMKKILSRLP